MTVVTDYIVNPTVVMPFGDEHLRAMGLGLSGAHRTGKTTLAKLMAEFNRCPFAASSASMIARSMDIIVDVGMDFRVRLEFQEQVLRVFEEEYQKYEGQIFIADRTPLDMAAYLVQDWHPSVSNGELDDWASDYIKRCMDLTNKYFFYLAVVQPGIEYKAELGKPAPNTFYQELLNTTITGFVMDPYIKCAGTIIPREMRNISHRATYVTSCYSEMLTVYHTRLKSAFPLQ